MARPAVTFLRKRDMPVLSKPRLANGKRAAAAHTLDRRLAAVWFCAMGCSG
jgi:hypothetical protein